MTASAAPRGDWMQTFTGRAFFPLDPRPDDVDIHGRPGHDHGPAPARLEVRAGLRLSEEREAVSKWLTARAASYSRDAGILRRNGDTDDALLYEAIRDELRRAAAEVLGMGGSA